MSRLQQFTRSMLSSYAQLVVNVFYTLASVPLALKYLSKAEFGLWALTLQIASYIALVDFGMGSSVARILIDYKDDRTSGRYGGAIKSAFFVGLVQCAIILVIGLGLLGVLSVIFRVPQDLSRSFYWLMAGQVVLTALTFGTRIVTQILYAWQRIDVTNYTGIVQLFVGFFALWIGFLLGCGVFSLLMGAAIGWCSGIILNIWACYKLGILPSKSEWGEASKRTFYELFNYGAEMFLVGLGTQLVVSSQTMLVSRQLGMEAAALWSIMTRVFTLVSQIVWRIIGNAMPAFAEMQVRGEWTRFWDRYRQLFIGTNVFAGFCGILFAACNGLFVTVWTHGKFSWPWFNNVLLAVWMIFLTQQCCHNSIVMALKEIKALKYVYLMEGLVFVGAALALLKATGLGGMLICSVVATLLFTWLTGLFRIKKLSEISWTALLWHWQKPLIRMLTVLVPCWFGLELALRGKSDLLRLVVEGSVLGIVGTWAAVCFALPANFVEEITSKLPIGLRRPLSIAINRASVCGKQPDV